jgi:type VI secretion system protein
MMSRRRTFLSAAACVAASGLLSGCGALSTAKTTLGKVMTLVGLGGVRLSWREVVIAASDGANQNTATAVDVVLVLEETMVEKVVALPAHKWMEARSDLLKTYPGALSVRSFEVAPGQILQVPGERFGTPNVIAVFVFADYLSPGDHRMKVEQLSGGIMINLGARDFSVTALKAD